MEANLKDNPDMSREVRMREGGRKGKKKVRKTDENSKLVISNVCMAIYELPKQLIYIRLISISSPKMTYM